MSEQTRVQGSSLIGICQNKHSEQCWFPADSTEDPCPMECDCKPRFFRPVPPDPQADQRWTIITRIEKSPTARIGGKFEGRWLHHVEAIGPEGLPEQVVPASQLAECRAERERLRHGLEELVDRYEHGSCHPRDSIRLGENEAYGNVIHDLRALLSSDTEGEE